MSPVRLRFVVGGSLELAADAFGDPHAPPVLLLHGGGQTRHAWGDTAEWLAASGFRAIAVDARGHGESGWDAEGRYHLEHFAEDLCAIARALEAPPAIVGASLGGSTAMLAVGEMGLEATSVVLVDIAPRIEPSGVERIFAFMTAHPNGFASLEDAADAVADYLPHRRRPDNLEGLRKNLRRRGDRLHWHYDPRFVEAMRRRGPSKRTDLSRAAQGLAVPTLLVRGRLSDLLSEEGAQHFLELVPHADYVDVSGAAHMVAGDANDRFSEAVVSFLKRA
jgi:non-heme chloroperoxidase